MDNTEYASGTSTEKWSRVSQKKKSSLSEQSNILATLYRIECLKGTCQHLLHLRDQVKQNPLLEEPSQYAKDSGVGSLPLSSRPPLDSTSSNATRLHSTSHSLSIHETICKLDREITCNKAAKGKLGKSTTQKKKKVTLVSVSNKWKEVKSECCWEPKFAWDSQKVLPFREKEKAARNFVFQLSSCVLCGDTKRASAVLSQCFSSFLSYGIPMNDSEKCHCYYTLHYRLPLINLQEKVLLDQLRQQMKNAVCQCANENILRSFQSVNDFHLWAPSTSFFSFSDTGDKLPLPSVSQNERRRGRKMIPLPNSKATKTAFRKFLCFIEQQLVEDEKIKSKPLKEPFFSFLGGSFWNRFLEHVKTKIKWMEEYFSTEPSSCAEGTGGRTDTVLGEDKLSSVRDLFLLLQQWIKEVQANDEIQESETFESKCKTNDRRELISKAKLALLLSVTSVLLEESLLFLLHFYAFRSEKCKEVEQTEENGEKYEYRHFSSQFKFKDSSWHDNHCPCFSDRFENEEMNNSEFLALKRVLWVPSMLAVMSHAFNELVQEQALSSSRNQLDGESNHLTTLKKSSRSMHRLQHLSRMVNSWKGESDKFSSKKNAFSNSVTEEEQKPLQSNHFQPSTLSQARGTHEARTDTRVGTDKLLQKLHFSADSRAIYERKRFHCRCLYDMCSYLPTLSDNDKGGEIKDNLNFLTIKRRREPPSPAKGGGECRDTIEEKETLSYYFYSLFIPKVHNVLQQLFIDLIEKSAILRLINTPHKEKAVDTHEEMMVLNVVQPKLLVLLYHTMIQLTMTSGKPNKVDDLSPSLVVVKENALTDPSTTFCLSSSSIYLFSAHNSLFSGVSEAVYRWMTCSINHAIKIAEKLIRTIGKKHFELEKSRSEDSVTNDSYLKEGGEKENQLEEFIGCKARNEWLYRAYRQLLLPSAGGGTEHVESSPVPDQFSTSFPTSGTNEVHTCENVFPEKVKELYSASTLLDPSHWLHCTAWSSSLSLLEFFASQTSCIGKGKRTIVSENNDDLIVGEEKNLSNQLAGDEFPGKNSSFSAFLLPTSLTWEFVLQRWSQSCELTYLLPKLLIPFPTLSSLTKEENNCNSHASNSLLDNRHVDSSNAVFSQNLKRLLVNGMSSIARLLLDSVKKSKEGNEEGFKVKSDLPLFSATSGRSWYCMQKASEAYDTSVSLHTFVFLCDELQESIRISQVSSFSFSFPCASPSCPTSVPTHVKCDEEKKSDLPPSNTEMLAHLKALRSVLVDSTTFLCEKVWIPTMSAAVRSILLECLLGGRHLTSIAAHPLPVACVKTDLNATNIEKKNRSPAFSDQTRSTSPAVLSSLSLPQSRASVPQQLHCVAALSEHLITQEATSSTASRPLHANPTTFSFPSSTFSSDNRSAEAVRVCAGVWMLSSELGCLLQLSEQWFSSSNYFSESPYNSFSHSRGRGDIKGTSISDSKMAVEMRCFSSFLLSSSTRALRNDPLMPNTRGEVPDRHTNSQHLLYSKLPTKVCPLYMESKVDHHGRENEAHVSHEEFLNREVHLKQASLHTDRLSVGERWRSFMLVTMVYPLIAKWMVNMIKQSADVFTQVLTHECGRRQWHGHASPLMSAPPHPPLFSAAFLSLPTAAAESPPPSFSATTASVVESSSSNTNDLSVLSTSMKNEREGSTANEKALSGELETCENSKEWCLQVLLELYFFQGVCYIICTYALNAWKSLYEKDFPLSKEVSSSLLRATSDCGDEKEEANETQHDIECARQSLEAVVSQCETFFTETALSSSLNLFTHPSKWRSLQAYVAQLAWHKLLESSCCSLGLPLHQPSLPLQLCPLLSSGSEKGTIATNTSKSSLEAPTNDSFRQSFCASRTTRSIITSSESSGKKDEATHSYRQVPRFLPLPILPTSTPHTSSSSSVMTTARSGSSHADSRASRSFLSISGVAGGMKDALGRLSAGRDTKGDLYSLSERKDSHETSKNAPSNKGYQAVRSLMSAAWKEKIPAVAAATTALSTSTPSSGGWKQKTGFTSTLQRTFERINPMVAHANDSSVSRPEDGVLKSKKAAVTGENVKGHSSVVAEVGPSTSLTTTSSRGEGATSVLTNVWSSLWNPP